MYFDYDNFSDLRRKPSPVRKSSRRDFIMLVLRHKTLFSLDSLLAYGTLRNSCGFAFCPAVASACSTWMPTPFPRIKLLLTMAWY